MKQETNYVKQKHFFKGNHQLAITKTSGKYICFLINAKCIGKPDYRIPLLIRVGAYEHYEVVGTSCPTCCARHVGLEGTHAHIAKLGRFFVHFECKMMLNHIFFMSTGAPGATPTWPPQPAGAFFARFAGVCLLVDRLRRPSNS